MNQKRTAWLALILCVSGYLPHAAMAAPLTVLHSFGPAPTDGISPETQVLSVGSYLYGTAGFGGAHGYGIAYRMQHDGSGYQILHHFTNGLDGYGPEGDLITDGAALYGTTSNGGSDGVGVAYKMGFDGSNFQVIRDFPEIPNQPQLPDSALTLRGNTLFGTTYGGGTSNRGTVFRMNKDGAGFQVLHNFTGTPNDGQNPSHRLTLVDDSLYGVAWEGGNSGAGVLFRLDTDGSDYAVLRSFAGGPNDGFDPLSDLLAVGTTLYGTTWKGGAADAGTVFRVNTDGTNFELLHSFGVSANDGRLPVAGLTQVGSRLFGTTDRGGNGENGTVFMMNLDGSGYEVLHRFAGGPNEGRRPSDGNLTLVGTVLYGTTESGGILDRGTVYSIQVPVPEPSTLSLVTIGVLIGVSWSRRPSSR